MVLPDLLFDKKEALPEDERTEAVVDDADENIGAFLFVKGGEVGTAELSNRSFNFVQKKRRNLPGIAFSHQHGNNLVSMFT